MPSSPIRFSAGISTSSKKTVLVWWLIIRSRGWTSSFPVTFRRSTMKTESPCGLVLQLVVRRGARQQQHQVGLLHARDENLLPVDDVAIALANGAGLDARGLRSGIGLGDGKGLQAQLAAGDAGKIAPFLFVAAVAQQRAHDVHLRMAGAGVAAASG